MLYRGDTIVILELSDISSVDKIPEQEMYSVVVFSINGKEIGLLTSEVDDIITFDGDIDGASYTFPGVMGTFIYNSEITMLIDLFTIASTLLPDLVTHSSEHMGTILVVDDSKFFRNQLVSFLNELGYVTFEAEDGAKGLEVLANYLEEIDMVYTDIEMPVMNGLEFAKAIKTDAALNHLPVVALSSLTNDEARQLGTDAGLDDYLVKMNKEQIIESCNKYMVTK
jgi:two-component system chemotaxis sensor kinase CheA